MILSFSPVARVGKTGHRGIYSTAHPRASRNRILDEVLPHGIQVGRVDPELNIGVWISPPIGPEQHDSGEAVIVIKTVIVVRPRREIAALSGVHVVNLSKFANAKKTLTIESAESLAKALGLHMALKRKRK